MWERQAKRYSAAQVVKWLTGDSFPIGYCFLAGETFCFWDERRGDLLLACVEDGDSDLHQACRDYLRQCGAAFGSTDEVRAEVRRRGLPGAKPA